MNEEFNKQEDINEVNDVNNVENIISADINVVEQSKDNIEDSNVNISKNNNTKKVLIVIIGIIILLLIALTIYVVVDKKDNNVDDNKDNNIQEENKDNEETDKTNVLKFNSISNYDKNNTFGTYSLIDYDDAFIIETNSIEEKKCDGNSFILTNNGLNVEANCVKDREDDLGNSYAYNITTKNNKVITVNSGCFSCGCTNLYSNNNYIIEYYSGCSINGQSIIIYNINDGEKIFYDNYYFGDSDINKPYLATSSGTYESDFKSHGIVFNENKLYYVLAYPYDAASSDKNAKCKLMKVDLSNNKFIETEIDSIDCYYRSGSI